MKAGVVVPLLSGTCWQEEGPKGPGCLVGLVGPPLWDERGEEGADEGPGCAEEAWLRESSSLGLVLLAPPSFLTAVIVLQTVVHQTLLRHR